MRPARQHYAGLWLVAILMAPPLTRATAGEPANRHSVEALTAKARRQGLKSNHASRRNNGSAAMLRGRVLFCSIFVSDTESGWTAAERKQADDCLKSAAVFLEREAKRRKIPLDIRRVHVADVDYAPGVPTDLFAPPTWTNEVLRAAGARSGTALLEKLKAEHKADQVMAIIHVNKAALSYNLAYYGRHIDPKYKAERAVCFTRYPDRRPTVCASYAHEILHCFGAGELYFPYDRTPRRKQRAGKLFPDDIMYRVDKDIAKQNVGDFTAYRIGWRDTLDRSQKEFED
jgi:hypothetical protein